MSTLIVLNPVNYDMTTVLDSLLNGTAKALSDTVVTLPYVPAYGIDNIAAGSALLDSTLHNTDGPIKVLGYLEGCQVATKWLRDHGTTAPIDPDSLSFLLIANAERRYTGLVTGHANFDALADTAGLPTTVPYQVTEFCRQYDPYADFPNATAIYNTVDGLPDFAVDGTAYSDAMTAVEAALSTQSYLVAVKNAIASGSIASQYFTVEVDDPANTTYTDPAVPNVTYVWAPTYPVPLLTGIVTPAGDYELRFVIETDGYARPVHIPMPDYPGSLPWTPDVPPPGAAAGPITGWWVELHAAVNIGVTPRFGVGGVVSTPQAAGTIALDVVVASGGAGRSIAAVGFAFSPAVMARGAGMATRSLGLSVTIGMTTDGVESYEQHFTLSSTPVLGASATELYRVAAVLNFATALAASGVERYERDADVAVTPAIAADYAATSTGGFGLSVTPSLDFSTAYPFALAVTPAFGAKGAPRYTVALAVTPVLSATGTELYPRTAGLSVTPTLSMGWTTHATKAITLSVTPALSMPHTSTSIAAVGLSVTPSLAMAGRDIQPGSVSLTVTPALSFAGVAGQGASNLAMYIGLSGTEIDRYANGSASVLEPSANVYNANAVAAGVSGLVCYQATSPGTHPLVSVGGATLITPSTASQMFGAAAILNNAAYAYISSQSDLLSSSGTVASLSNGSLSGSCIAASSTRIWFGGSTSNASELITYNPSTSTTTDNTTTAPKLSAFAIAQDESVAYGAYNASPSIGTLYKYSISGATLTQTNTYTTPGSAGIVSITIDQSANVFVATANNIYRFSGGVFTDIGYTPPTSTTIRQIAAGPLNLTASTTLTVTPAIGMTGASAAPPSPVTTYFAVSGNYSTSSLPAWFRIGTDYLDLVGVGGGGGGAGQCFGNVSGGSGASWNATTITPTSADFPLGCTVGAATGSVSTCTNGGTGNQSVVNSASSGTLMTATGGAGGSGSASGTATYGQSPGNYTYEDTTYTGGAAAPSGSGSPAPAGNAPGGGGAGGTTSGQHGGPGAAGGVWITARYHS